MDNKSVIGTHENIRVLLVDLSVRFGGASVRTLNLARHLFPWQAAIAGLDNSPVVNIARDWNIPVKVVGSNRTDPMIPFRLCSIIRNEEFQVVDTQNIQSKFWVSIATRLTDGVFVSTLNSSYSDENAGSWKGKLYSFIDRMTNSDVDHYIAVSRAIADGLLQVGIRADMIDLVTNAVALDEQKSAVDRNITRRKIGIPSDSTLCISVGRLVWAKGYEDLVDAFRIVARQVSNIYCVILGGGVLFEQLSERIEKSGLSDRFRLLGHLSQDQVAAIMDASDIFVMTSRSEGVPYAILEAGAKGLPILATRCGGIPEVYSDNSEALLVPVGDVSAIARRWVQLVTNKKLSSELAKNAKLKIKREFGLATQIEGTRLAYLKAVGHRQSVQRARVSFRRTNKKSS